VNTTKRHYESMYVVDANLTDEQVDSIIAKYSSVIADQGGTVNAVGRWDKRRLAYEIQGRREGLYILMFFEAEPAVAKELDRIYRISDDVFRHLITRVEPQHVDTSRIVQPQPVAEAEEAEAVGEEEAVEAVEEGAEEAPAETVEEETAAEVAVEAAEEDVEEKATEESEPEPESAQAVESEQPSVDAEQADKPKQPEDEPEA